MMSFNSHFAGKLITVLLFISLLAGSLSATEYLREPPNARSMAMGGTGISSANDTDAMFYNPAAMANVFPTLLDFFSINAEYDDGGAKILNKLNLDFNLSTQTLTTDSINLDEALQILRDNNNKFELNSHVRSAAVFSINREGLRIGISASKFGKVALNIDEFSRQFSDLELVNAVADPNSSIRDELRASQVDGIFRNDTYLKAGVSVPLWKGVFVLGLSYTYLDRQEQTVSGTVGSFLDTTDDSYNFSNLTGNRVENRYFDVGVLVRIPGPLRLRLGAVYKNATDVTSDQVQVDPKELAFGVSLVPVWGRQVFGGVRLTLAADYRDALGVHDTSSDNEFAKKIHAGAELAFFPYDMTYSLLALRVGYNQGYVTYGAETNFALYRTLIVGYASYGEEIGNNNLKVESRRHAIYVSLGY